MFIYCYPFSFPVPILPYGDPTDDVWSSRSDPGPLPRGFWIPCVLLMLPIITRWLLFRLMTPFPPPRTFYYVKYY